MASLLPAPNITTPANKRSAVWQFFGYKDGDATKEIVTCKLCYWTVCYKTQTTTNMAAHMKRKHSTEWEKSTSVSPTAKAAKLTKVKCATDTQLTTSGQMRLIGNSASIKMPSHSSKSIAITQSIGRFIASDLRPYSVVENAGFRGLLNVLEPRYQIPSRNHFTSVVIPSIHKSLQSQVESYLHDNPGTSLTTDGWTSVANDNYVTFTAHLVDKDWVARSFILSTVACESHTAVQLQSELEQILTKWNLVSKGPWAPAVTTDNASNVTLSIRLADLFNVRCLAHTINLAVQKVLKLDCVNKALSRVRAIVRHFHRSPKATARLRGKQKDIAGLPAHKLILDVTTRWNSVYDMLERFIEQQAPIVAALVDLECHDLVAHFSKFGELEAIKTFLHPMKIITTALSSESSPTCGMLLPTVSKLRKICLHDETDSAIITAMKAAMVGDLEGRYTDEDVVDFLRICQIFDPRFRSLKELSEFAQNRAYDNVQEMVAKLINTADVDIDTADSNKPTADTITGTDDDDNDGKATTSNGKSLTAMEIFFEDDCDDANENPEEKEVANIRERIATEIGGYKFEAQIAKTQNPLDWWKDNEFKYPLLAKSAKRFLAVQATSVASERVFSAAGSIVTAKRSVIDPLHLDELLFIKKNLGQV